MPVPTFGKSGGQRPWRTLRSCIEVLNPLSQEEIIRPSGKMASDLAGLRPGTGAKSAGKVETTRPGGHWGYKQGAFIADLDVPARTVTASSQQDWIIDEAVGLRRLCPRECAAIQTFPSNWKFAGSRISQYRQIGNAVPPVLAEAIGSAMLSNVSGDRQSQAGWNGPAPLSSALQSAIDYTIKEDRRNGHSRQNSRIRRVPEKRLVG
jgi:DNA (cytosine-5)-methyltransferase 1